jgi:membrane-bound inhibitor of C-type lysozyme
MELNEVNEMNGLAMRCGIAAVAFGCLVAVAGMGQEAPAAPAQPHNNVRTAIRWKQSDYTCEGGAKLTVYLADQTAKVRFGEKVYVLKQTRSADGNRYSDGKVVWWGKGKGGFLQEDTPNGDGKMIVKGCNVVKPSEG